METGKKLKEVGKEAAQGQLPSNEQIKTALEITEQALQKEKGNLGTAGRKIVRDVHEVAEAAKIFLDERNPDESLQKIYQEAFQLSQTLPTEEIDKITGLPLDNDIRLAQESLRHLRYVGFLLLNSATFRRLVLRLLDIARWTVKERMEEIDTSPLKEEGKTIQEAVGETVQSAKEVLQQEREWNLNENEKEEIRNNLKEIFRQLGGNAHFQKGVQSLFLLIDRLTNQLRTKADETQGITEKIQRNPHVQNLFDEMYNFLVSLVGKDTVDVVNTNTQRLYDQLQKDEAGRLWFREAREYFNKTTENPTLFNTEEHREKGIHLIDRARELGERTKNWRTVQNINIALRQMVLRLNNDMARIRLSQSTNKLARDLLYDEKGNFSLNTEAMQQVREVLVPAILEQLKYIPVPRIENHDHPDYEYIIDNVVFNATNIVPEKVKISTFSQMKLKPKKLALKNAETTLRIKLKDIEVHLRNVKLWYKRKHFPKIEDEVTADVDLGGETNLVIEMLVAKPSEDADMFRTVRVDSTIDDLRIHATAGKHDILMNIFTTLFSGTIKNRLKEEIDRTILNGMVTVDHSLNQISRQLPAVQTGIQSILYQSYDQVRQALNEISLAPKEEILPIEYLEGSQKEEVPLMEKKKEGFEKAKEEGFGKPKQFEKVSGLGLKEKPQFEEKKAEFEKGPEVEVKKEETKLVEGPKKPQIGFGGEKGLQFGEKEPSKEGVFQPKVPEQQGLEEKAGMKIEEEEESKMGYEGQQQAPQINVEKLSEMSISKEKEKLQTTHPEVSESTL